MAAIVWASTSRDRSSRVRTLKQLCWASSSLVTSPTIESAPSRQLVSIPLTTLCTKLFLKTRSFLQASVPVPTRRLPSLRKMIWFTQSIPPIRATGQSTSRVISTSVQPRPSTSPSAVRTIVACITTSLVRTPTSIPLRTRLKRITPSVVMSASPSASPRLLKALL